MHTVTYLPRESASVTIKAGEFLVIYTDGVSEASNSNRELFEESRLQLIVEEFKDMEKIDDA